MSGKVRGNIKWDSSTEEEDMFESKYKMKLRDSIKNTQQPSVHNNEVAVETRRRGRGPSKRPCLNKNALMARENRLRKKAYMEKIENKLAFYQEENQNLSNTIRKQAIDIKRLTAEVAYLRGVLNNDTNITALLKTINDGLRKISAQKKTDMCRSNGFVCMDNTNAQSKCTSCMVSKENVMSCPSNNMFANDNNDHSPKHTGFKININRPCMGTKKQINCKNSNATKTPLPFLDSDHTYTISNNPMVNGMDNLESEETGKVITSDLISQESNDNCPNDINEVDGLIPIAQENFPCIDVKKDTDTIDADYDQLSSFDMDIFENFPKYDEISTTVDSLHDTTGLFTDEELFHSLDNTGICLHMNSDNVSLEFCSICHLNSKNSLN